MNAMIQIRAQILADSNARIETAKAMLAEAEAHKATVLDLLARGREELIADLDIVQQQLSMEYLKFQEYGVPSIHEEMADTPTLVDRVGENENQHSDICAYCDCR